MKNFVELKYWYFFLLFLFDRKDYYNKSFEREFVEIIVVEYVNIVI